MQTDTYWGYGETKVAVKSGSPEDHRVAERFQEEKRGIIIERLIPLAVRDDAGTGRVRSALSLDGMLRGFSRETAEELPYARASTRCWALTG